MPGKNRRLDETLNRCPPEYLIFRPNEISPCPKTVLFPCENIPSSACISLTRMRNMRHPVSYNNYKNFIKELLKEFPNICNFLYTFINSTDNYDHKMLNNLYNHSISHVATWFSTMSQRKTKAIKLQRLFHITNWNPSNRTSFLSISLRRHNNAGLFFAVLFVFGCNVSAKNYKFI